MKKASIVCISVIIYLSFLISLSFNAYEFNLVDIAYGTEATQLQNKQTSNSSSAETMFDKPWSNLEVDIHNIVIYPERVEPRRTLTFTYTFGNEGTTAITNATIMCLPPNMSLPNFLNPVPYMWWRGEVSKGPISISQPRIEPQLAETGQALVDTIFWRVENIPQKGGGADTNAIVFRLEVDISQVKITQDLQCWVGLFYGPEKNIPKTFGIVKIRAEVKPKFEIAKSISNSSIFPGDTNTIKISYRNNSLMPADSVYIYDYFYSEFRNVADWITIETVQPQPDVDVLPELIWRNLAIPQNSPMYILNIVVKAKPYQAIKNLFQDAPVYIVDNARIVLQDELFNSTTDSFRIEAKDLRPRIEPKLFGQSASPGFPLLINGWIKNAGATPLFPPPTDDALKVKIWLNDQSSTPFLDTTITSGIRAGDSIYVFVESPPLARTEGIYRFYIEADYENRIRELDETNNIDSAIVNAKIESFNTTVNNATRSDRVNIFGMMPAFPNPILSYVMITDQNYHYITGLADSIKWLAPDDPTPSGEGTVKSIWSPVLEYHEENPDVPVPESQDVYLKTPPLNVTRITDTNSLGFSVALIMDGNISNNDTSDVNKAARKLVSQLRSQDRMAILKFSNTVSTIQPFTNNLALLNSAIVRPFQRSTAHLFNDAVYQGITETIQRQGRKAVLVYTSGRNYGSSHNLAEVIQYADTLGVPVFVFGFGNADTTSLRRLAQDTGGLYVYDKATRDMWYDFKLFAEMFKNYYVLSHTTTDTTLDGSWRLVDVTAKYPSSGFSDRDYGKYKAPNIGVDLFITKEADTDSFSIGGIDTIRYATEGERYTYSISYGNFGSLPAQQVIIKDVLPDSVDIVPGSFIRAPTNTADREHQLFWGPDTIMPGSRSTITFDVTVKNNMPPWQVPLVDSAWIIYENDRHPENNTAINIVYAVTEPPDPPEIRVTPDKIKPRDPVMVEVICFEELRDWDIRVTFADGSYDDAYADSFIAANPILLPGNWIRIIPDFKDTKKRTESEKENIVFTLTARNVWDQHFTVDAFVTVEAPFELYLDRNIFNPDEMDNVNITLILPADLTVKTRIYNVAGEFVRKLPDKFFLGGETYANALSWDGTDEKGRRVASGVYVIIAEAGSQKSWRKLIVLR